MTEAAICGCGRQPGWQVQMPAQHRPPCDGGGRTVPTGHGHGGPHTAAPPAGPTAQTTGRFPRHRGTHRPRTGDSTTGTGTYHRRYWYRPPQVLVLVTGGTYFYRPPDVLVPLTRCTGIAHRRYWYRPPDLLVPHISTIYPRYYSIAHQGCWLGTGTVHCMH